jgi:hypothetical protein
MASLSSNKGRTTRFELVYRYSRETKGTWCYELCVLDEKGVPQPFPEGQRSSGSNMIYLLKTEYPQKPGAIVKASYEVVR